MKSTPAIALLGLGAAAATLVLWLLKSPGAGEQSSIPAVIDRSAEYDTLLDRFDRIEQLLRRLDVDRAPVVAERAEAGQMLSSDVLRRLDAIEQALSRHEEPEPIPGVARDVTVAPKAKDQDLVLRIETHGKAEPGANTRDYWCWSPKDVYQALGKPDATQWHVETGQLDWFYWNASQTGALQFRFEGGIVIGVWP